MCDPITATMAALSVGQSALQIQSVNRTVEAQSESVNRQTQDAYHQAAYEHREQASTALAEGYQAEIAKRQAVGKAVARNATLGIRGNTAAEMVAEELQVGNYNVASARDQRRNAGAAYEIGTAHTYNAASAQQKSLQAQAPTMFESILTMGASGLQGYMTGLDVKDAFTTDPTNLPTGTT